MNPIRFLLIISVVIPFAGAIPIETASADTTLVYGELARDPEAPEKEKVLSAQRIYLREGALALETFNDTRFVLFDRETDAVQVVDRDKNVYFDLDTAMVAQMAERLTETQRKVLDSFEEKAAKLKKEDRRRLREILNDLHAATDLQTGKTPEARYEESEEPESVGEFEAGVIDAYVNDQLVARYFLVDHEKVDMSKAEYETLVAFQKHMKRFSEQIPGTLRRNFGDVEMLARSGRIPVQVKQFDPRKPEPSTQRLLQHFDRKIDETWFQIPEDCQAVTLRPDPIQPGKGA